MEFVVCGVFVVCSSVFTDPLLFAVVFVVCSSVFADPLWFVCVSCIIVCRVLYFCCFSAWCCVVFGVC